MQDSQAYFESMQNSETRKGFMSVPKSLEEAKRNLSKKISKMKLKKPTVDVFAIEVDGEYAGHVELHDMNQKYLEHIARIGYCLHPKFRGKGIMTKAVGMIVDYAFKKYKLKRIEGICRTFNKASAHVLERTGFKLEGIMRKNKFKDGKYLDDMVWAKIR